MHVVSIPVYMCMTHNKWLIICDLEDSIQEAINIQGAAHLTDN